MLHPLKYSVRVQLETFLEQPAQKIYVWITVRIVNSPSRVESVAKKLESRYCIVCGTRNSIF